MNTPFWKMHGSGNDFILFDDRSLTFPTTDTAWIKHISQRRTGIGCEGVILIQPSETANFRMRFFNPDGGEVDMCGNGARCVARLAYELKAAPAIMSIETRAGQLSAKVLGNQVTIHMTEPSDWRLSRSLELAGQKIDYHFVNSGVPHVVIEVSDLKRTEVKRIGAAIRNHPDFAPAGTNVNFVSRSGPSALQIRTFERGVEDETLACGTGMVAAGLIAGKLGWVTPPIHISCAFGDTLVVQYRMEKENISDVTLAGPATHVFTGIIQHKQC